MPKTDTMTELQAEIHERAMVLEREAHTLRAGEKPEEAFHAYDEAASLYKEAGEHLKAALCYASAASCWNIKTGWLPIRNAATRNKVGAEEAMQGKHHDYARSLFREAAVLFETEGDFENYSACFWGSQLADAKRSWAIVTHRRSAGPLDGFPSEVKLKDRSAAFFRWTANVLSRLIWGYGERPFRTIGAALVLIVVSAVGYTLSGQVAYYGLARGISFWEAVYFSFTNFTTVGFGDYTPLGWARGISVLESVGGITLMPLFLIALTRRYLRMYR